MKLNGLTVQKWDVAFGIYVATGLLMDVALAYCSMQGAGNASVAREVLELRYLAESVTVLTDVQQGFGHWKLIKDKVDHWLTEFRLHEWVSDLNARLGVAPAYETVFAHYRSLCQHAGHKEVQYESADSRRKWAQRYMTRWQSVRSGITTHEADSAQAVVDKAPIFFRV